MNFKGRPKKALPMEDIINLRNKGARVIEIARRYNVCDETIRRKLKEVDAYKPDRGGNGCKRVPFDDIKNWDKPARLEPEDIRFLKKYGFWEFLK